ncbi:CRS2-associated factor 1, mitochondrial-like isoform X2 [Andrographis paniculata]|uniref:CRS2-associated factor 1, mitochondrial-like isoform X2 n=1 Tax=Andrographis paniculata TaxID=175694 RepID=UPI0021E8A698|nr:CRS2-associated factor 1, mitochondrial-like isoform X2 [Andrographis paniculata]
MKTTAVISRLFRLKIRLENSRHRLFSSTAAAAASELRSKYSFVAPPSLNPQSPNKNPKFQSQSRKPSKPPYRPPSSLDRSDRPIRSDLPFDFRFSYTESSAKVRPIGLREPKYSPFGPGRLDRVWTGVCAPAVDPKVASAAIDDDLEEKRRAARDRIQGEPLTNAERKALVERYQRHKTKRQINIGRDGLTHNMLNDIHNHWKLAEAVRIKCMGVPTVDMKNICTQLEDKTMGAIIFRRGGQLVLYRGLSMEETKEMRKRGLSVPVLTRLSKNGYYGSIVPMVRDAFLNDELVRIDCKGLPISDYKKIGCKLRDLVPCILVSFEKEQIVVWRGKDYKPVEGGFFVAEDILLDKADGNESTDYNPDHRWFDTDDFSNDA